MTYNMNQFILVSMCLFLVIVGLVMYYLNTRIKTLESSVTRQNEILSDFISSMRTSQTPPVTMLNMDDSKIYVSDDSEEESDTESNTESNTDSDDIKEPLLSLVSSDDIQVEPITMDQTSDSEVSVVTEMNIVSTVDAESINTVEQTNPDVKSVAVELEQEVTYKKMKVDELRNLIQQSNLAPDEEVHKLKKQELLHILENN